MFCAQCGKPVPDGAKFCKHCGSAVEAAAQPSTGAASDSAASVAPSPEPAPALAPAFGASSGGGSSSTGGAAGGATNGLIARLKNILLSPSSEWPVIADEPSSPGAIYLGYVAPLAAIGVIATFIGHSIFGFGVPFLGHYRVPIAAGLAHGIISYLLAFLGVFLVAWLVDALAPTFGGQRDQLRALKVTAYSFTAGWVGAVLNVIPALGIIGALIGLYGFYLLYLGLPVLMRCPQDKSIGYTILVVVCAIVMWIVLAALTTGVVGMLGFRGLSAMGALSQSSLSGPQDTDAAAGVLSSMFGGKSEADRARVNEALKTLEKMGEQAQQAEKSAKAGGPTGAPSSTPPGTGQVDVNTALGAVGQIVAGGKNVEPVDFHKLKDMLPESLPGMQRKEASGQSGEAMGLKGSSATAHYADAASASINIEIADMGSLSGLAGLASKFDPKMEKETDTGYERTSKVDGQLVHERYDRRSKSGEVGILLADRFAVTVRGDGVDPAALTAALKQIDLAKLASLR
jgi:hypothetical protein